MPTRDALIAAGEIVGREFALDSESWRAWEEGRGGKDEVKTVDADGVTHVG